MRLHNSSRRKTIRFLWMANGLTYGDAALRAGPPGRDHESTAVPIKKKAAGRLSSGGGPYRVVRTGANPMLAAGNWEEQP
jgi:hypothetical protein